HPLAPRRRGRARPRSRDDRARGRRGRASGRRTPRRRLGAGRARRARARTGQELARRRVRGADRAPRSGSPAMTGFFAVYRREMLSLWVTPLAWVLLVVFLLLEGAVFYSIVVHFATLPDISVDTGPVQAFFGQESILLLLTLMLLCPALTMRTFAEERRSGTIEALLTAPVTPTAVVLGKYLAVVTTYAL